MSLITIPNPFHICVDDVGWFCGRDDRKLGGPSRSGMPRHHVAEDYIALENLGKAIGMKLSCAFVLGEWDMEGIIQKFPNSPRFGEIWESPEKRDKKEMERMVEAINSSPHIDFLLHGIYHGYYKDGVDYHDSSDYFYHINGKLFKVPEEEIVERLNAFFRIMEYHKINKKVNQFIPPSGTFRQGDLSEIFKSYGIIYFTPVFDYMEKINDDVCDFVYSENGVTVVDRNNCIVPWDEVGTDFLTLPDFSGIFGTHWPNFLHEDPSRNHEVVANAAAYINRCCSRFDTAPAEDISVCAMQQLILKYGKISESNSSITVDLSSIPDTAHGNFFLVNSKNPLKAVTGGSFEKYKKYEEHITYKIIPNENTVKIEI